MATISKVKKSLLYVISFLIITMFSLLGVVISNLATTDLITKDNNVSVAEESVCAMSNINATNYVKCNTFTISTADEWKQFVTFSCTSVQITNANGSTSYIPCTFSGKTVKLIADIDFLINNKDKDSIYPVGQAYANDDWEMMLAGNVFKGTFDGQGHTLSNYITGSNGFHASQIPSSAVYENIGLFACLGEGATIKNLRLDNITYFNSSQVWINDIINNVGYRIISNMGAIAGRIIGNATIDSCSAENLHFWNNRSTSQDSHFSIGGIVGFAGYRGGTTDSSVSNITNCNVLNMTVGAKNQGTRNWILGYEEGQNVTVKDCVYSGVSWVSTYGDDVSRSNLVEYFTDVTPQNADGYLSFASISKYGDTAWQKNATNDRPYLTIFKNPTTYTLKTIAGQGTLLVYTVDDKSTVDNNVTKYILKIPSGTTLSTTSLTWPTLKTTSGDSIVFASANSSGDYKFIKWEYSSSDKTYTAKFETSQTRYTLTFNNATKSKECTNSGTPTITQPTSNTFTLLEGAQITLSITNKILRFSFVDSDRNDNTVRYIISTSVQKNYGWYFSYCGNNVFDNDNMNEQNIIIDSNITISPKYNYKILNVVFWKDGFDNYQDIELTFKGAENENYSGTNNSGKTANGALFKLEYGGSISAFFRSKDVKFISDIGNYSENKEVIGEINNNMYLFSGFNVQDENKNQLERDSGYYYVKSNVEIYPIVEERANVSFIDVVLYIPNGITLTDDGTEIFGETYTVKMVANSELRYYIDETKQEQRIILFDKSLNSVYDILEFTISGENISPQNRFRIDDVDYSTTGSTQTVYDDILAGESIKVIPIYKYSVNVSKNFDDDAIIFQNVSSGITTSKTDNNTSLNIGIENQTDINITITKQSDNNYIYKFSYELDNNEISFECITKQLKYIVNNININGTEMSLENGSTITFTSKSVDITILAALRIYSVNLCDSKKESGIFGEATSLTNPTNTYKIICGTSIEITFSDNLKEIKFEFINFDGDEVIIAYTISGYGWYFSGLGYSGTESNVKNLTSGSTTLTPTTDISFEPTYSYKLYEVTFQTSGFTNSNYVKSESSNSAYTFNLEYGSEISQTMVGDVQVNLLFNDGTQDRTITYTITDGQYYISGVNYSVDSASGDTYTVKKDVTIYPKVDIRTTTMPTITFAVVSGVTLTDENSITQTEDYQYSFISGSTLTYYNNTTDDTILIRLSSSGVQYAEFKYRTTNDNITNPKFKIMLNGDESSTEYSVQNADTDIAITTSATLTPKYTYEVTFQTSGFTNSNYVKSESGNSAYTFYLEYGSEISQTMVGDVQVNLGFNDGTQDRTITYTITNSQYCIYGTTYTDDQGKETLVNGNNTYTIESCVTIYPNINKRTTTMPTITFAVVSGVTLTDENSITQTEDYQYSFISGSTLTYYNNTTDDTISIRLSSSGVQYAEFKYRTTSNNITNPKFTIMLNGDESSTEYSVQNADTDIMINESATLTPKYTYNVTIEKNTLVGMTADEKIGIDYGSTLNIGFSTTEIDSKIYDVVTITYYNNGQESTKTYTINSNSSFIKMVTADGATYERMNNQSSTTFGANNLVISITTAQKTYNAEFS